MDSDESTRQDVIRVCQVLDGMGLVEGFGHVSARLSDGNILITPARGLRLVAESELLIFNFSGELVAGEGIPAPLERWMHLAVYRARPDVNAICRTHSRYAAALGAGNIPIQAAHGFGGMLGLRVSVHPESDLITDDAMGRAVAATLGEGAAVLLRGNGALVTGATLQQACVRAIYLEEAAFMQVAAGSLGGTIPFTPEELASRSRWYEVETARAWEYYTSRFAP